MKAKISILIITRNRSSNLKQLLKSVVKQRRQPDEVIVVDNGSIDFTYETVMEFATILPVKYYYEKKPGIPYARNLSIRKASGDWIIFTDDDCVWPINYTSRIEKAFMEDETLDGIIGYSKPLIANPVSLVEQFYHDRWLLTLIKDYHKKQYITDGRLFDFKNAAIRMGALSRLNNKLFNLKLSPGFKEDIEFGLRLMKCCRKVRYVPELLSYHSNSLTLKQLILHNLHYGRATWKLKKYHKNIVLPNSRNLKLLLTIYLSEVRLLSRFYAKLEFSILVLLYPLFSKLGYWMSRLNIT